MADDRVVILDEDLAHQLRRMITATAVEHGPSSDEAIVLDRLNDAILDAAPLGPDYDLY